MQQGVFLIKESFRTIMRHQGVTAISIVIMSLTLLILAVFLLATDNMLRFVSQAKEEMKVYVYLEDPLDPSLVDGYHRQILSMPEVEQVIYISKEEALIKFKKDLGEDSDILSALEANPLPASFLVSLKDDHKEKEKIEQFAAHIREMSGIEEVSYGEAFLDKFSSITKGFFYVDAFLGLVVILSSVFIISNAVRLSVVSRKRTIEILKLVGATNRFIATPFVLEGALEGGIAAFISMALLSVVFFVGARFLSDLSFFSLEKALAYVLLCVLIGALGSFGALKRYLRY
ncbi:MAG: permease-like cell division protein FtsX [Candidatus Latescibacterota bacterium]